jgi:AAA domain
VVLVGVAGSGKSTLAARAFAPTQVLSTDGFRAMVADDPAVAVVLDVPPRVCAARRPGLPPSALRRQRDRLRCALHELAARRWVPGAGPWAPP